MTPLISKFQDLFMKLLGSDSPAFSFCKLMLNTIHNIDDCIDEPNINKHQYLETYRSWIMALNHPYYVSRREFLFPTILVCHQMSCDSAKMEESKERWQLRAADVLRHGYNELFTLVIYIEYGADVANAFSKQLREISFLEHRDDPTSKE